jgi:hypothetical protein
MTTFGVQNAIFVAPLARYTLFYVPLAARPPCRPRAPGIAVFFIFAAARRSENEFTRLAQGQGPQLLQLLAPMGKML